MARNCECGRYLGARTICECGRRVDASLSPGGADAVNPFSSEYSPVASGSPSFDEADHLPPSSGAAAVTASWVGLRGRVAEGEAQPMGNAGGVVLVWLGIWLAVGGVLLVNGPRIAAAMTNTFLSLVLTFLGPVLVVVVLLSFASRIPGATGCLMVLPSLLTVGSDADASANSSGGSCSSRHRWGWYPHDSPRTPRFPVVRKSSSTAPRSEGSSTPGPSSASAHSPSRASDAASSPWPSGYWRGLCCCSPRCDPAGGPRPATPR